MKQLLFALVLLALAPLPASNLAAAGDARSGIDEALTKFVSALNAGDAGTLASLYTEDAVLLPPGGERVDGRAAIQDFWQGAMDSGLTADTLHAVEVFAEGDTAGEVGVFVLSVPGESEPTKINGKYIVIWKRNGDQWQLHRDIWNTH